MSTRSMFVGLSDEEVRRLMEFWSDYAHQARLELVRRAKHPTEADAPEEVVA